MPFTRAVLPPLPGKSSLRQRGSAPQILVLSNSQRQVPRTGWRTPRASRTALGL